MDVTDGNRVPMGYQQIDAATLAASTALTVPSSTTIVTGKTVTARLAVLRAEAAPVRWRDDGQAPTASIGMHLEAADGFFAYTGDLSVFRVILESGTPKLNVSYYY